VEKRLEELKTRLLEVEDLQAAAGVLSWDQWTYLPAGGAIARARQIATLNRLSHEKFTDPEIGRLLDSLRLYEESMPYDSFEASLIRVTRRAYERAVRVPPLFIAELNSHCAASYAAWTKARPANDFRAVEPHLERMLDLSRKLASYFPDHAHVADPLIDYADEGMTVAIISDLFSALRERLVRLVQAIEDQPAPDDTPLCRFFPREQQLAFGLDIVREFGFDFERGRQDLSPHPFTTEYSTNDVRITTRVAENDLRESLFSLLHECGHALYEQHVCQDFEGTPLSGGTSSGVHESQSRLWENLVGRSRAFWSFYFPRLKATFPGQLAKVSLDTFYRAVNRVGPSLIRTAADEVTYNLHVMLRFDLELALLEGRIRVAELPDAWRERMISDLGVDPPNDRDGVLQDVHWFSGTIGGSFQGYTLGNILSAQFFQEALHSHPEFTSDIENGTFDRLLGWLTDNIYQHGSKYMLLELVERTTGSTVSIEPYCAYLEDKYDALYDLGLHQ
jgi:carboxypeptidase Taq